MFNTLGMLVAIESPISDEELSEITETVALNLIEAYSNYFTQILVVKEAWGVDEGTGLREVSMYTGDKERKIQSSFFSVEGEEIVETIILPNLHRSSLILTDRLSFLALTNVDAFDDISVTDFWDNFLAEPDLIFVLLDSETQVRNPIKKEILLQYEELAHHAPDTYHIFDVGDENLIEQIESLIIQKLRTL